MSLLRGAARAYLLHRMTRRRTRSPWYAPAPYGHGRRGRRQRSGFGMWGPLPSYSRRTRGGSHVRVTGCCLPLPLALALGGAAALRQALTSR